MKDISYQNKVTMNNCKMPFVFNKSSLFQFAFRVLGVMTHSTQRMYFKGKEGVAMQRTMHCPQQD